MAVVKINAIRIPEGAGPELKRFHARAHSVDGSPGFLGFQLLRPVKGGTATSWSPIGRPRGTSRNWASGPPKAHAGEQRNPCRLRSDLLEFEVVDRPEAPRREVCVDRWEPATIPLMFPLGRALLPGEPLPLRIFWSRAIDAAHRHPSMSTGRCSIAARIRGPEPVLRPPGFGVVLISQGHEVV